MDLKICILFDAGTLKFLQETNLVHNTIPYIYMDILQERMEIQPNVYRNIYKSFCNKDPNKKCICF